MSPRYWVRVHGPRTTGAFGSDSHTVTDPTNVDIDPITGALVINTVVIPRPSGCHADLGQPKVEHDQVVLYPKGAFDKVVIGLISPRS